MTKRWQGVGYALFTVALLLLIIEGATRLSNLISDGVMRGLILAARRVIPTSLPFMIISDVFIAYARPEYIPILPRIFEWIFGLPKALFGALVIGWISGFPIGARIASDLYRKGEIERSDAERLAALASMPSPAFVIGVVGGMLGDRRLGILLLISLYIGTAATAKITSGKRVLISNCEVNIGQRFDFVESVKRAGMASIGIAAFISIFSMLSYLVKFYIPSDWARLAIIAVLEAAGAAEFITKMHSLSPLVMMGILALSLGFGGVSVLCQSSAFLKPEGLSVKPYFLIRICAAIISGIIASGLYFLCFIL